ncbi:MAG: glutamate--cysteine ligase [Segniliparus sp.]|uniref:glutamate--cysteine ligase n=1 Tax=Segniliparus sp. TaxID=2804064 RepID=UPI003F2CBCF3
MIQPPDRARERLSVPFASSAANTLGVEWEFALVDQDTKDLVNCASAVIDEVTVISDGVNPKVHREFLRNTVEVVTGVCRTVAEAMDDIRQTVSVVHKAAQSQHAELFAAGTHPFAQWSTQQWTDAPRYHELMNRTQWWGRQMLIWGVHVHVGVDRREKVLPILSSLLNHYPHLLALSGSSPLWSGVDTGYASNRAMMFQQLPTAGLPFQFGEWREFEEFVFDQTKTGIIEQVNEIRWDIRPSPSHGTIEVRICDGVSTLRELSAITALICCLVADLNERLDRGEELPSMPPWHVQENKWRAARYGLDAIVIVDEHSNERLVTEDLSDLLERLAPQARKLGCADELASVEQIPVLGASYQRQRLVAEQSGGDLRAVVGAVVEELRSGVA